MLGFILHMSKFHLCVNIFVQIVLFLCLLKLRVILLCSFQLISILFVMSLKEYLYSLTLLVLSTSNFVMGKNETFELDYLEKVQLSEAFQSMESCFTEFDKDLNEALDPFEFSNLCEALFRNEQNQSYELVEEKTLKQFFDTFDLDGDGFIRHEKEFELCWEKWIRKIIRPVSALIVVDVQNDFISGSFPISKFSTAGHKGEDIIEPINKLISNVNFDRIFYVRDWHPENHVSFFDNVALRKLDKSSKIQDAKNAALFDTVVFEGPPLIEQKLWPKHCIQDTWGSQLHEKLKIANDSSYIFKGTNPDIDSYSAFFDNGKVAKTNLDQELKNFGVTDVYTCGLAYEICVGLTALHALELGYRTIMVDDAARGISLEDIQTTKTRLEEQHALVIQSDQVQDIVSGKDRRPELGVKLAIEIKKQLGGKV